MLGDPNIDELYVDYLESIGYWESILTLADVAKLSITFLTVGTDKALNQLTQYLKAKATMSPSQITEIGKNLLSFINEEEKGENTMNPARRKKRKRMIVAIAAIMAQSASGMVFSQVLEREDKPLEQWQPNDLLWIEDQAHFLVTNRHFSFSINTQEENACVLSDDPFVCSIPSFLLQSSRVGRGNDADNPVLAAFKNEKRKLNLLELVLGLENPRRWKALRKQRENLRKQYRRILFCREDGGFGIVSMSKMTDRNFALVQFSNCSQDAWVEICIDITDEVDVSELEELCRCIAATIHFRDGFGVVPSPAEFDLGEVPELERPVPTATLGNDGDRTAPFEGTLHFDESYRRNMDLLGFQTNEFGTFGIEIHERHQ